MKKLLALILVLILSLSSVSAFAEANGRKPVGVDFDSYVGAFALMCDFMQSPIDMSTPVVTKWDDTYAISRVGTVRMIANLEEARLYKISSLVDMSDDNGGVYKMCALAAALEAKLYDEKTITSDMKHDAFQLGLNILNTALDSGTLQRVAAMEGDHELMAAQGEQYWYSFERIDGEFWFSVQFTLLPPGLR